MIEFCLRALYLTGACLVLWDPVSSLLKRMKMMNRLEARKKEINGPSGMERKVSEALLLAFGKKLTLPVFLGMDVALFFVTFLLTARTLSTGMSLIFALLILLFPWFVLLIRSENARRRGSKEGMLLISELLRNYRISGRNIYMAMEETVNVKELKVTGKILYRLLLALRESNGPESIRKATEDLAYGLGTNWGHMLSYDIQMAAESGRDITAALEDILVQLRDAGKLREERNRINGESKRIVRFFIPLLYPISMLVMVSYMDLDRSKVLKNQFQTPGGLLFFFLILFFWIGNVCLITLVDSKKFDF